MGIKSNITDSATGQRAEVDNSSGAEKKALVVATRPLKTYDNVIKFFTNSDYGTAMNQNTSTGGTPEKVHNGTDDTLWTGSNIEGNEATFDSIDQNYTAAGSKSVKVDKPEVDDVFQFNKGSDLDCTNYVSLTMWIYVDKDWEDGDSTQLYGWNTDTNLQIGDAVNLEDYFNYEEQDTWHKITISLSDMGDVATSTVLDALRVKQVSTEDKEPKYYLDDIQFEETGTPIEFKVEPSKGTWLHVDGLKFIIADAYTGTVADGTMPSLPYNAFLGVSKLATGIIYKRVQEEEIVSSANIKQLLDAMSFSNAKITGSGSDGTNTWLTVQINFTTPVILKAEYLDYMSFTINDDLSGLLEFKTLASAKIEDR